MTDSDRSDKQYEPATFPGDDLIEINDPEVNAEQIMTELRQRIQKRREEVGYEQRTFPTFGAATPLPEATTDLPAAGSLYHHLRQANQLYNQVETAPLLAPSQATRLPVVGRLWQIVRDQAHQLILFYVNRYATHQTNVNRHLVSVANELTRQNQEQQQAIRRLQEQVEALQRKTDDGS